jgi:hypothetical protein
MAKFEPLQKILSRAPETGSGSLRYRGAAGQAVGRSRPGKMKIKHLPFLLFILLFQGCSSPFSSNPPLELAVTFEKGVSQVPQGYYVFIEYSYRDECSAACQCAPGPVKPNYNFTSSGELVTDQEDILPALSTPIVGFFGYDRRARDQLYVIDSLPYQTPPYDEFIIYSVDAQGTVTVDVDGIPYFVRPGQSWTDRGSVSQAPAGCTISYNSRLSNYGLLPQAQIQLGVPY